MMKMKNIKAIFRRGQTQASSKSEQGQLQGQLRDDLTRSSSVTNLNADTKNKGAFSKLRNSASKDRLDKLIERKHEKKASNNNKLAKSEVDPSLESIYEIELLQKQLNDMAKEKSDLALELGESREELTSLKSEIIKLKMFQEQSNIRIDQLCDENTSLRNRLRDVAHSPLSDNEKQQLLLDSQRHSSAPASIALNLLDDGIVGDITACPTPEWDKHSSSNVSEVSVACLQDKINQMQETHYSTNEELQATLQELTDLQRQLTELQQDNERLLDEKNLMFDSLCRQTERLNDTRTEVESLRQLLYRDKDETGQFESIVDREQKLVNLLKSAQDERESLLVKQEQLNNEVQETRTLNNEQIIEIEQLTERVQTLESTLDAKHAEHRQLDQELAIAKDQSSGRQIEINRLSDLLDNARTKINELEQERELNDKSEIDELLDNARKEKDCLESEVANLKEQVARSRNEAEKLKEQISILQEECKVIRNNAKCTQSELEYKCEKLANDKSNLSEQLQQIQEAANELQVQAQCQLEDKRQLSAVLSETQRNLSAAERKNAELENELVDLRKLREDENEEWEKFQNDLLTSVRVANDFKSEAQQELQKMIMENKNHRERVRQLEAQIDKMKGGRQMESTVIASTIQNSGGIEKKRLSISNLEQETKVTHRIEDEVASQRTNSKTTEVTENLCDSIANANLNPKKSTKRFSGLHSVLMKFTKSNSTENLPTKSENSPLKLTKLLRTNSKREKRLSLQEERNLAILNNLYTQIDQNQPVEYLTPDQKYILRLKDVFNEEENNPKLKHVGKLSKNKVAISKPLLGSVLNNPRLKEITENTNLTEVDTKFSEVDYEFDEVDTGHCPVEGNLKFMGKFDDGFHSNLEFVYYDNEEKIQNLAPKSHSMDNVYFQMKSNSKATCTDRLNILYSKINPTTSEDQLTKEEKFIIKLKRSLDEMGHKSTLKRKPINRNKIKISEPIHNSILTNPTLFSILKDPTMKYVDEVGKLDSLSLGGSSVQFTEIEEGNDLRRSLSCTNIYDYQKYRQKYSSSANVSDTDRLSHFYCTQQLYDLELRQTKNDNSRSYACSQFSNLTDDEVKLVERIQSSSEFTRPISDINEEDLKVIKIAQLKYLNCTESKAYSQNNTILRPLSFDSALKHKNHENYKRFLEGMIDSSNDNQVVNRTSNDCHSPKITSEDTAEMNGIQLENKYKAIEGNSDLFKTVFENENKCCATYITKDGKIFGVVKYKNVVKPFDRYSYNVADDFKHAPVFNDDSAFRNNNKAIKCTQEVDYSETLNDPDIFHDAEDFYVAQGSINKLEIATSTNDLNIIKDVDTQTNDDVPVNFIKCVTRSDNTQSTNTIERKRVSHPPCTKHTDHTHTHQHHKDAGVSGVEIIGTVTKDSLSKPEPPPKLFRNQHACNNTQMKPQKSSGIDSCTLERVSAFYVLNNPPRCTAHHPPTTVRPSAPLQVSSNNNNNNHRRKMSPKFETTRKRFENIIQAYKSETLRATALNRLNQGLPVYERMDSDQLPGNKK